MIANGLIVARPDRDSLVISTKTEASRHSRWEASLRSEIR